MIFDKNIVVDSITFSAIKRIASSKHEKILIYLSNNYMYVSIKCFDKVLIDDS